MSEYIPELGQMAFGQPTGEHDCPDFVEALFFSLWRECGRVFSNKNQREMSDEGHDDPGITGLAVHPYYWGDCNCGAESPVHSDGCAITKGHADWISARLNFCAGESDEGGFAPLDMSKFEEFEKAHPYPKCSCGAAESWKPRDEHLTTCSTIQPNFAFGGVEIRWYKYPGRGMSVNVDWDEKQWREWFDKCFAAIRDTEKECVPDAK